MVRVLIIGGTGQVGAAVLRTLTAEPSCAQVVMVNRRAIPPTSDPRVRQVVLDTADTRFPAEVARLAQSIVAQGGPVYGASCVGVGKGRLATSHPASIWNRVPQGLNCALNGLLSDQFFRTLQSLTNKMLNLTVGETSTVSILEGVPLIAFRFRTGPDFVY
jgi:NAD(P)-dependent dehydrogenase (short-subunit alcohol dehydrogenase family)